ncbi:MAG TPA: NAD(+)/NADH kinase [Chloroflexota bacterium]|jgi:NAD+ kinase|nr:NAD(+)/NADH kinase [Chloroflexota bacterium]
MTDTRADAEALPRSLPRTLLDGVRGIALLPAHQSPEAQRLAPEIAAYLTARGARVLNETAGPSQLGLVVSLGGDGLMMRAARRYPDVPILGINFGHFGFLTAAEAGDWRLAIQRVLDGDFQVRVGPTLSTRLVPAAGGPVEDLGWAVNDVVVHGGLRFVQPALFIDRQYVNDYPGDGMVIATPTGSTAYCMAAGGPVLLTGVAGFAVVPISCHSPIRVSLVVPEDVELAIRLEGRHSANLIVDGESEKLRALEPGDTVFVRKGSVAFRQISFRSFDWFAAFQSKFNYQIRRAGRIPAIPDVEEAR